MALSDMRLNKEQVDRLQALDKDIAEINKAIARAKGVGIDTSEVEKYLKQGINLRDRLLKEYGPQANQGSKEGA